jgi:hypothetical protein
MQEYKSASQSKEPHKFFERFLSNDLNVLSEELALRYGQIERAELDGVTPIDGTELWQSSNSISTIKWTQYNVFQFHIEGIHNLYKALREMVVEACDYYNLDFEKEQFMVQGWFNINHAKGGLLDWHDHGPGGAPFFHGYYCVNAEPSKTHYVVFDKQVDNINVNNRAILSEMGHPHAMADWDWEGSRITVAYDILPLRELQMAGMHQEQHWIPLV